MALLFVNIHHVKLTENGTKRYDVVPFGSEYVQSKEDH